MAFREGIAYNDIMEAQYLIVYCTVPDADAGLRIARTLIRERLCACINRIPGVVSHYVYEGEYCEGTEELLLIKTTREGYGKLQARLEAIHPYDVPEIVTTEIGDGNEKYLAWLHESMK